MLCRSEEKSFLISPSMIFFFLEMKMILLIQTSNTLNRNTESNLLKVLEDDAASKLIIQ